MIGKLTLTGVFVLAALAAAAAGGYFALRHNANDSSAPGVPVAMVPSGATATPTTDVAVGDTLVPPAPAAAPVPSAATTRPAAPSAASPGTLTTRQDPSPEPPTSGAAPLPAPQTAASPVDPPAAPAIPALPPTADQTPVATVRPAVRYDQVTIAADAVLGLRLASTVSSDTAQLEDKVNARLSRDVMVDGRVALASGARLEGAVTTVERGGKFRDRPRIGFTFHTLVLADSTRVAIHTETIYREGDSPAGQANAKIGGSGVVGAILGGLIGGKKGAIVGSAVGAAGGVAAVASGDRKEAVVTSGTTLTVRLTQPVSILIEREYE